MQASEVPRAVAAAMSTASSLDLTVDDAIVVHDSNKLTLRLLPCDVLARVAPVAQQVAQLEVELAQRLAESGCPVAALEPRVEPRVYERDGFVVTLWTYYEPVAPREISPADYADALERLHAGMRKLDVPTPHFTDRVEQAQQLVANRDHTPALADADRELLGDTLRSLRRVIGERGGAEQLLHGEPHPGNMLTTKNGLLFIDLETCCRGPVEFDLAHAPEEVSEHYPGVNQDVLGECRILVLAMITTWRWDRGDQLPNGRQLGTQWLSEIPAAGIERVTRVAGVKDGLPVLEDGRVLDVANVVWSTGFHHDFSWLDLPGLGDGEPPHRRGVVDGQPGLYLVGLHFLYAMSSAMIHGVGRDAEHIARQIAARQPSGRPATREPVGA